MNTPYRLGLDLGTNSMGWAIWSLGSHGPVKVIDAGVRIFGDGRKPGRDGGLGDPLAVQRRDARSIRRRRDRLLQRKRNLVNALIREGLWSKDPEERLEFSLWDPYKLRTKALSEPLTPEELGRVFLHLCQRRGFKSNRKVINDDDEYGINRQRIQVLNEKLKLSDFETLGEFLNTKKREGIRFRTDAEIYPGRHHYETEFQLIKERQKAYHTSLNWDHFFRIIFHQRHLKTQIKGKCRYYSDQDRAHKSLPSSHRFRILQELANLRMIDGQGKSIELSRDERDMALEVLEHQKTLRFTSLRKKLGVDFYFNLEYGERDELKGNSTSVVMRKPNVFGPLWDELDAVTQDAIIWRIMEAEQDKDISDLLKDFSLSDEQKETISTLIFHRGLTRYSSLLHRECNAIMLKEYCGYPEALNKLGFSHRIPEGKGDLNLLPYYGEVLAESCIIRTTPYQNKDELTYGKIGNPTVHIALNQLRKVVNSLIEKYGKPAEIVVELSRELKVGRKKLDEIIKRKIRKQKEDEALIAELDEIYGLASPSQNDKEKLIYYKELLNNSTNAHCPYCRKIIPAEALFTEDIEIEHILPFSRTLDNRRNNKTLAHQSCKQLKKKMSPHEAFGHSPAGFDWNSIQAGIKNLPKGKQRQFQQNAMKNFESEASGFIQRQLTDNAYIARVARRYLTSICPANRVWGVTGQQTAVLRRKWNLNLILSKSGKKNRSDHRHHAVDAVVIGLLDRSLIRKISDANKQGEEEFKRFTYSVPEFPGGSKGLGHLFNIVKNILPSIKPNHGFQGRLFKETAYGQILKAISLPTKKLTENLVENIVPASVQKEFRELIMEVGFAKAKRLYSNHKKSVRVFQKFWVTSKPITSLKVSDLQEFSNNTKGPSDLGLRRRLKNYLERYPKEKMDKVFEEFGEKFDIRRVRYIPKNQEITPITSSPGKGYELSDYAYVDIWKLPAAKGEQPKYKGSFVSRLEATKLARGEIEHQRPHPGAKKLMRLFKSDMIALSDGETWKYYQISGFAKTQNRLDIQPIWKADDKWFESTNMGSLNAHYEVTGAINHRSINVLWQKNTVKKIYIHYNGTFR